MLESRSPNDVVADEGLVSAQLEALWEAAVGIGFFDRGHRFTRVNRTLAQMIGLSPEAHFGRQLTEVLPRMGGELPAAQRQVMETGEAVHNLNVQGFPPGSPEDPRHWTLSLLPVRSGGSLVGLAMTATDVTERQRVEGERRLLQEVVRQMPAGVMVLDARAGELLFESESIRRILGVAAKDFLQSRRFYRRDGSLVELRDAPLHRAAAKGEQTDSEDIEFRAPDGLARVIRVSAAPLRDAEGAIIAAVGTYLDVTQENRSHNLEQQLMGIVGHDLRNPLSTISLALNVLTSRGGLSGMLQQSVDRAARSVARIQNIVRDLLDFTSVRHTGQLALRPAPVNLAERARQMVEDLRAVHDDRALEVMVSGDCSGVWDGDRLDQVLSNLIGNALQHSPPGSPIRIHVTEGKPGYVELCVHNQGPAIPPALLPNLFDVFTRGQAEESAKSRSIGMGLYIARAVVEAHGGEIEVRSSELEGTSFVAKLPRNL